MRGGLEFRWLHRTCAALLFVVLAIDAKPVGAEAVGRTQLRWQDSGRMAWGMAAPRPLQLTLWYPTAAAAPRAEAQALGPFALEAVVHDAPPRTGRLPLLLLSHGTGGSALSLSWLARGLAARGYLVAGVDHHGNTAAEPEYRLEAFVAWWDRAQDLRVALDRLLDDPVWAAHIDAQRIGALGFSLGGYTVLTALGARLDNAALAAWHRACQIDGDCRLPPELAGRYGAADVAALLRGSEALRTRLARAGDDWREPRVRAGMALAPVLGALLRRDSLESIRAPLHMIASRADQQAPAGQTALAVANAAPDSTVSVLHGDTHYGFLNTCTEAGRRNAPLICVDPQGAPREELHRRTLDEAARFFARALPDPMPVSGAR